MPFLLNCGKMVSSQWRERRRGHGGALRGSGQRYLATVIEVFQCFNHQFGVRVPTSHSISDLSFSRVLISPGASCYITTILVGHSGKGGSSSAMIFEVSMPRNSTWFPAQWQFPLGLGLCGQAFPGERSEGLVGERCFGLLGSSISEAVAPRPSAAVQHGL